jgi:hypothetical protein
MKILFCALLTIATVACGQKPKEKTQDFVMPEVPAVLVEPEARANFLVEHYWDRYNFADTSVMRSERFEREIFSNYLYFLGMAHPDKAESSLTALLTKIEPDTATYRFFSSELERYFYDPNSPMRNEELYIPVIRHMSVSPATDSAQHVRLADRLRVVLKNRPGERANDFVYTIASGRSGRMYDIRAQWTILFFNNPGCHACRDFTDEMMASGVIRELLENRSLTVLGLYPDEDMTAWREYAATFPKQWIYSYDKQQAIRDGELYDLKAIPSIYLLDQDKRVIIKDAINVQQIIDRLSKNF